ncbi:Beta-lactamase CTX-M-1 [bacterium HR26]|nr:Beta-lactamase CTX-M-1 [bacterium HR26]
MPEEMTSTVREAIERVPGRVNLLARDLDRDWELSYRAEVPVTAASVIKLLILAEAYRQFETGEAHPDEPVRVEPESWVGGSGVLRWLRPGLPLTLRDLAVLMVIVSDNTASNLLIDRLGFECINGLARRLGLEQTVLARKFLGRAAQGNEPENLVSARDMAALLAALELGQIVPDGPLLQDLRQILKAQQFRDVIPGRLPAEAVIGNKTGSLPGHAHDAAIIWAPAGRLVLVLLSSGLVDQELGRRALCDLALACYRTWVEQVGSAKRKGE